MVKIMVKGDNVKMNKLNDNYEEQEIMKFLGTEPKRTITRSMVRSEHYYPLTYTIESFDQSEELIKLLLTSNSGDIIKIYLSTAGGDLAVTEQIVAAIVDAQQRDVFVLAQLGLQVCSAGTFIALSCSDIEVSPNTQFMLHNWATWGGYGNTTHLIKDIEFNHKQSVRFMKETYSGFLSDDELNDLIEHPKDLWFNSEQVMERWENLQAYRQAEFEKMLAEIQAAQEEANKPPAKKTTKKKST